MKNQSHHINIFATTDVTNTFSMNFSSILLRDNQSFLEVKSSRTALQYSFYGSKNYLPQTPIQVKPCYSQCVSPKVLETDVIFAEEDYGFSNYGQAYAKWRNLLLVAKFVHILKKRGIEKITNGVQLRKSVAGLQKKKQVNKDGPWIMADERERKALKAYQDQAKYFMALERGATEDIKYIRDYLSKDPRNYLNDPELKDRRANMPNKSGYTPLYIACKNGNMQLLKLLLEFKANPYQMSTVSIQEQESILMVAARWGHVEMARHLIENVSAWSKQDLTKALEVSRNMEIKKMIKSKLGSKRKGIVNRFICG